MERQKYSLTDRDRQIRKQREKDKIVSYKDNYLNIWTDRKKWIEIEIDLQKESNMDIGHEKINIQIDIIYKQTDRGLDLDRNTNRHREMERQKYSLTELYRQTYKYLKRQTDREKRINLKRDR